MENYYSKLIWRLTLGAYLVASNIDYNLEDRVTCTKFLFALNKYPIALNYESNKFKIYYTVFAIVALIKKRYGTELAYKNLIAFYPDLDQPWILDALKSDMFDLTPEL